MILKNGEQIQEKDVITVSDGVQTRTEKLGTLLDEIKQSDKTFTLRLTRPRPEQTDQNGQKFAGNWPVQGICWDSDLNNVFWQYVRPADYKFDKKAGSYIVSGLRSRIVLKGEKVFNPATDFEEIFYLKYLSSLVKKNVVYFFDSAKEEKKKVEINEAIATAQYYIMSPDSPIGSEQALRELAAIWGVGHVDKLSYDALRNQLWDRVKSENDGYAKFVAQVKKANSDTSRQGNILMAIQRGIIELNDREWILNTKGGLRTHLVTHSLGENSGDAIIKFLTDYNNTSLYDVVVESLNDNKLERKPSSKEAGYEEEFAYKRGEITYATETRPRFIALCKKYDVPYTKTKAEVRDALLKEAIEKAIENI